VQENTFPKLGLFKNYL